jgi:hypothetical protein
MVVTDAFLPDIEVETYTIVWRVFFHTREDQQVTWNSPITAPSALFQIRIASGVGSNFTWHLFRSK